MNVSDIKPGMTVELHRGGVKLHTVEIITTATVIFADRLSMLVGIGTLRVLLEPEGLPVTWRTSDPEPWILVGESTKAKRERALAKLTTAEDKDALGITTLESQLAAAEERISILAEKLNNRHTPEVDDEFESEDDFPTPSTKVSEACRATFKRMGKPYYLAMVQEALINNDLTLCYNKRGHEKCLMLRDGSLATVYVKRG